MNRQLSKLNSPSRIEDPPSTLPTSPPNKFKRTAKKLEGEETNATSERTDSVLSQDTNLQKPHILSRTNRIDKRTDGKSSTASSQIEDPFSTRNMRFKSEPAQVNTMQNFMKKSPMGLASQLVMSPQNETKPLKATFSPRANNSKIVPAQEKCASTIAEEKGRALKRSGLAAFLIDRLYRNLLNQTLKVIKDNKRVVKNRKEREVNILVRSAVEISCRYEQTLKAQAMNRFKLISAKKFKQNYLIEGEFTRINSQKGRDFLPNILHALYRWKINASFDVLKKNRARKQLLSKVYHTLFDFYERRKIRSAFQQLKDSAKRLFCRKMTLIGQIQAADRFCGRLCLAQSFRKILLYSNARQKSKAEVVKPALTTVKSMPRLAAQPKRQIQPLVDKLKKDIASLQQKITQKKNERDSETRKLKKMIDDLKRKKAQSQKEVSQKKAANDSLKVEVEGLSCPIIQIDTDEESKEAAQLKLVQRIHYQISRASQQDLSATLNRITKEIDLEKWAKNPRIQQWLLISQKTSLQRQIDAFQAQILGQGKAGPSSISKMVREQNLSLSTMIKNYIRQRYLWGQVQRFISTVI